VLVLHGSGGSQISAGHVREAAAATPGWAWSVLGGPGAPWLDDPWPALCRADVVVTHGGLNAIADVAAARKPAVVAPQARPHGEQLATSRALDRAGLAVVAGRWPRAASWPSVLRAALELGGERWNAWSTGTGAADAAKIIETVAGHHRGRSNQCAPRS
jgi:predicted glycosyltransferase